MHWIMFILVSIFTAFVNLVFLASNSSVSQKPVIIFNGVMLSGYLLMYIFYGSKRQKTLKYWQPIKAKTKSIFLRLLLIGLCVGALLLAYKLSQAATCSEFLLHSRGAVFSWALTFICKFTGPIVPAIIILSLSAWMLPSLVKIVWQRT